uniref:Dentin sialophosphoprotein-like n=1 Tax=Panagrellus redivivus TaxID=6233 RepID=A0A7E4UML9_PANRE
MTINWKSFFQQKGATSRNNSHPSFLEMSFMKRYVIKPQNLTLDGDKNGGIIEKNHDHLDDTNCSSSSVKESIEGDYVSVNLLKVKHKKKVHFHKVSDKKNCSSLNASDKENDQIATVRCKKNLKAIDKMKNSPISKDIDKESCAVQNINDEKTFTSPRMGASKTLEEIKAYPILKDYNSIPKVYKKTKRISAVSLDNYSIAKGLITKYFRAKLGVFQPDPYDADDESVDEDDFDDYVFCFNDEGSVFYNPAFLDDFDPGHEAARLETYAKAWTILSKYNFSSEDDYRSSE